ncbi:MAG: hypothetical protein KAU20_03565, partial [Nanoarchaeota archaeon]|nr:hypothetical protein [Nanoarchaeota archaeon]
MKQYKKLINAMILVVLISIISFFVYAYTLPACCCYPGGEYGYVQNPDQVEICEVGGGTAMGDNVMDSLDCVGICGVTMCDNCKYGLCSHYENCEDNLDGGTCSHLGEGYSCCSGNCTLQEGACNVPGLNVGIINLQRGNDRGYRQITLNWNSNLCPAGSYEIFRCEGSSCTPTLSVGLTTTTTFADKDINWDKVYSYKVKGYYLYQGEKDAVINNVYSGNLECENQITSDRFCIHHPSYYQNEPYVSYIYGEGININGEEYSSKDNKHFFCSSSNLLSGETACQGGNICVGGECIIPSECVDVTNNPLGMYYSIGLCEGTIVDSKYCFLDKSEKNVDNCYPCSPDMKCYDYRTEEACERDNCNAGSCSWRETSSDLGTGVCIDLDKDNCALCNAFGTTGMENINTFNFVFDIYTLEKLDALSTSEYPCFKYQGECTSCGDIGCPVYSTQTECSQLGTSAVSLDNTNNIINPGGDSCGIDVCQWKSGKCVKNADGLSPKDCREDIENCEKDYFRPVATLTPIMTQGGVSSFTITVTDKASKSDPESIKYGYETYWCVYSGTDNCRYLDGGSGRASYEKFTTGTTLALRGGESDLRLCSGTDNCMDLVLGENILKHYSIDPAGNLGVVEDITFIASPGSVVPSVVNASIIGGNFVEGIYYTTNHNPIIYVEFVGSAQFISKVLTDIDGTPFGTQGGEGMAEVHQIEPSTLPNNNYIFTFSAENEYGRSMVNNYDLNFVVDSISPTLTIIPDGVVDTSSVSVNLSFSEKVFLDSVFIDGVNTTDEFKTTDNTLFRCTFSFNDGDHNIIVVAHDYAGNSVTSSGIFGVNADPSLRIEMAEPSYGVSPVYDFTIKLKTDNDAECKYTFNPLNIEALSYNTMTGFTTISGGKEHIKEHFTTIRAPDEINTFYVKCKDLYDDSITSKSFELSVDDTPPSFELAIADPDIVVTDPAYTDLKVRTDDYAVCDYTSLVDGTEGVFSSSGEGKYGFGKANYAEIILESTQTRNYNYSVTCMNKAELSSTTLIGFRVDRTSDMSITDLTDDYFNSTTVRLEIGNNLGSQCRYSPDNSLWAYFSQVPDTTRYFASVTVSGAGEHTYYVQCYRNGLWDPEQPVTISFTVDNTAPKMILVNSTSNCNNESLRAMWAAEEDSYSRVRGYSYSVYKSQTSKTIKNWTDAGSDSDEWQIIDNLDLIMGESYYIKVKAYNILDAYSTEMSSKKVTIDDSNCDNIIPNGDECSNSIDCLSGFCNPETKKCATPTCNDGYDNGDESDVDCGGDCDKCEDGKRCDN